SDGRSTTRPSTYHARTGTHGTYGTYGVQHPQPCPRTPIPEPRPTNPDPRTPPPHASRPLRAISAAVAAGFVSPVWGTPRHSHRLRNQVSCRRPNCRVRVL